jgi:hypothetical protein
VLAYPVRMSRGWSRVPPEMDTLLLDLAKTAKRLEKALGVEWKRFWLAPQLVRRLAMACSGAVCKVSLGSDAHYPRGASKNIGKRASLVAESNLALYYPGSG